MTRVLIADDHALFRAGLRQFLVESLPSAEIVVPDTLAALLRETGLGEIDYAPETRLILEVRDQAGGPVYRGYKP